LDSYSFDFIGETKNFHPKNTVSLRLGYEKNLLNFLGIYGELGGDFSFNSHLNITNGFRTKSLYKFNRSIVGAGLNLYIKTGINFIERIGIGGGLQYTNFNSLKVEENNTLLYEKEFDSKLGPIIRANIEINILNTIRVVPQIRYRFLSTSTNDIGIDPYKLDDVDLNSVEFGVSLGYIF
jgi:hypothetical protein